MTIQVSKGDAKNAMETRKSPVYPRQSLGIAKATCQAMTGTGLLRSWFCHVGNSEGGGDSGKRLLERHQAWKDGWTPSTAGNPS
jgi:hypothetical protein